MPQWAGSCWYYLRYLDPHNDKEFASKEVVDYWMPVDLYVGGAEHAVLHLLYARFWHKVLFDLGLVNTEEPYQRLVNQGMITSFAFQRKNKTLVPTDAVEETAPDVFIEKETGEKLERVIAKMSKSLKNVINPDDVIRDYGADSVRMYEMFMGAFDQAIPWSTTGARGCRTFIERVWRLQEMLTDDEGMSDDLKASVHLTVKKVSEDFDTLKFNTAIAQMMTLVNEMVRKGSVTRGEYKALLLILSPVTPHVCEEIWQLQGFGTPIYTQPWPAYDPAALVKDEVEIAIQVNGKIKGRIMVPASLTREQGDTLREHEAVKAAVGDKQIVKFIFVPGRLLNIVVK